MTIAVHRRTTWRAVQPDLLVGQEGGDFAGTIEARDGRFTATSGLGRRLGRFRSAAAAQAALEADAAVQAPRSERDARMIQLAIFFTGIAAAGTVAIAAMVTL